MTLSSIVARMDRLAESLERLADSRCDTCARVVPGGLMRFATVSEPPVRCPDCGAFEHGGSIYSGRDASITLTPRPTPDHDDLAEPDPVAHPLDITFRGDLADIWRAFKDQTPAEEYVVEGSAGTGKTFLLSVLFIALAMTFADSRWFISRATRASMNDSVLETFEDTLELLGLGAVLEGPRTETRRVYRFPNGSEIVPLGLEDRTTKMRSSEWDGGWINEGSEIAFKTFDELGRAMRGKRGGEASHLGQPLIIETNPDAPHHWINQRPMKFPDVTCRAVTRHADNPRYFNNDGRITPEGARYIARLKRKSPVLRDRLLSGLWVQAEGLIFDCWDPAVHLIDAGKPVAGKPWGQNLPDFAWYACGQDFGLGENTPGSLSLYGITAGDQGQRKMIRLRQWYRRRMLTTWWADRLVEWTKAYRVKVCLSDCADPGSIGVENQRLMNKGCNPIVQGCDKRMGLVASCNLVRDLMDPNQPGGPKILFVKGGVLGRDQSLLEESRPTCTEDEIPSYVWREVRDGQAIKDEPAPNCHDHGIDDLRYTAHEVWKYDLSEADAAASFEDPKTAAWLGDDED